MAKPMPRPEPVTRAALPCKENMSELLQLAARFHFPDLFDCVAAHTVDEFVEIDGDADVVRNDARLLADLEPAARAAKIDEPVLFVHFVEGGFGGVDYAAEGGAAGGVSVGGEGFGAA